MSAEKTTSPAKLCPTCGTRLSLDAARCLVCGTDLSNGETVSHSKTAKVQTGRMPAITFSLPSALGLLIIFLGIGAALVYFAMRQNGQVVVPTVTPTTTSTPTATITPTPETPTPTQTPLPSPTPLAYSVKSGDTCSSIAFSFGVTINSIVTLNNLSPDCASLSIGQSLLIPQPTPTPTPQPSATLSADQATMAACTTIEYTVQEGDLLGGIAANYAVPKEAISKWNNLVNDFVRVGQKLVIPLCERVATAGPTPTPTLPPPYGAPNPLLPADGAPFTSADNTITLQWSTVGNLRENESYAVIIEDLTTGQNRKVVEYTTDTKLSVPSSLKPPDNQLHVFRWTVTTMRQTGTDSDGNPIWESAGAMSDQRTFTW
jgi:LysM repeat protein